MWAHATGGRTRLKLVHAHTCPSVAPHWISFETAKADHQHRPQPTLPGHIELDTHADTTDLGSNCVILLYTGKESGKFHPTHQSTKLSGMFLL